MGNTNLQRFRFKEENYAVYSIEGDLADFGGLMGPKHICPMAFIILDDGERRWVLQHVFEPVSTLGCDGWYIQATAIERAEKLVQRIYKKGVVNLLLWDTWGTVFGLGHIPNNYKG